jgi:hypothetical protein
MSLVDTIKELIPSKNVDVYGETVCIRPLTLEKVGLLVPKLQSHLSALTELNVTLDTISGENNGAVILDLVSYFVTNGVDVLEDMSGVEAEVFKVIPIDKSVDIITAVIEINSDSAENLLKNWDSLAKILGKYVQKIPLS